MRMLLVVATSIFLVSEPAWAASYFSPPALRLAPYQYFTPPVGADRQASRRPVNVQIPKPENTTIGEEYAKGDIVIVNHERKLYFVEEPGHAIRYSVAIGKPVAARWQRRGSVILETGIMLMLGRAAAPSRSEFGGKAEDMC